MHAYKLEKEVVLYKVQFDQYCHSLYGEYLIDRLSLDLEGLNFRIKYMIKHNRNLYNIPRLKDLYITTSHRIHNCFTNFLYSMLTKIIQIPAPFHLEDIEDVLAVDVKIDTVHVKFKMILISQNEKYLEYVDSQLPDDIPFNLKPTEYFRFTTDSYNDGIAKAYPELFENRNQNVIGTGDDSSVFVHNLTFQINSGCSLRCTYCYQGHKENHRMSFAVAKQFIDNLLSDKYGYINRYNSPAIIMEFIGGEPLLEIELVREIYEYFLEQCYEMDHPWFTLHRISMCSNGMQYFDDEVQDFFKEYATQTSFNISIDGNKELHDSCRLQLNGEGSYDIDIMALNHYNTYYTPERNSKMTLAPSNIKYLYDSIINFINNGMMCINVNCVFESGWTYETALIEYTQLKKLADYLIDNDLDHIFISIFNERQEDRLPKDNDTTSCGGSGSMLSIDPYGKFYPCIRYMPSSVGHEVQDLCIGTVESGMVGRSENSKIVKMLDRMTRKSGSNPICFECPINNDCAGCLAHCHGEFGTPDKKATFACIQVIAEALANVYYWNRLLLKHPEYNLPVRRNNVPDIWALNIISKDELNELKLLECMAMLRKIEQHERINGGDLIE